MSKKNQTNTAQVETTEIENPIMQIPSQQPTVSSEYKTDGSQAPELVQQFGSVSAAIRFLDSKGLERGQIAKIMSRRYQHVRNVLITPLKKNG